MGEVQPDYLARTVKKIGENQKWTDVGIGYESEKGTITVFLSALPLDDKLLLFPREKK